MPAALRKKSAASYSQLLVVALVLLVSYVGAQGPGNPPRPPGGFPGGSGPGRDQGGPGGSAATVQYLPQGIVAVGANPAGGSGGSPGNGSPATNASPSPAAQPSPSPSPAAQGSPPPSPGPSQNQQPTPAVQPTPAAQTTLTPTPAADIPQQTRGSLPLPLPKPGAAAATPQAQPVPAQITSPGSAPAAAPASDAAITLAPAAAVGGVAQPLDDRNTVVDAQLRLQGPHMWPFDGRAQDALLSALASVMTAVPKSAISVVAVAEDMSQAGRRLQQAAPATDAHVRAQAADAATASTARSQLQDAVSNGKLADALRRQSVEIDSVSLLSADLAAPDAAGGSSGPNTAAIAGGVVAALAVIASLVVAAVIWRRRRGKRVESMLQQPEVEFKAKPFYEAYRKGGKPDVGSSIADIEAHTASDGVRSMPQPVEHALAGGAGVLAAAAHSRSSSNVSERVQSTIDKLQSHMEELKQMAPALPEAEEVEPSAPLHLTPSESMHPLGRIAAANSQLSAFTSSLSAASARPTVHALLARQAAKRRKLAAPGATGSKVMRLNEAMQYLTENSRFAGKYMLESAHFDGDSCIAATGKQISSGCPVTLKFFVDEDHFVHLRKFHQQARDTSFIPGVLDMFDEDEVALGAGVHNPACIVTERGAYSLATYMSRMERNPSASCQKSTLSQLLDCVAYLHARSMVHRDVQPSNLVWSDGVSRWRLTGCESWARKGSDAPLSYSLRYAAPEVVMADCMGVAMRLKMVEAAKAARQAAGSRDAGEASVAEGPTHHVVQAATDMWAVGACAWELLTGRPLFGDNFSDDDVVMALLGVKPLPFEADPSLWVLFHDPQAAALLQGLLIRKPEQRLTASKAQHIVATLSDSG